MHISKVLVLNSLNPPHWSKIEIKSIKIEPEITLSKYMKEALTLLGRDFRSTPELPQKKAESNAQISPKLNINISRVLKLNTDSCLEYKIMSNPESIRIDNDIHILNDGFWSFKLYTEQLIHKEIESVFEFYATPNNLNLITPKFLNFKILGDKVDTTSEGMIFKYRLNLHKFPVFWKSKIEEWDPPIKFVDKQLIGPYLKWHHQHHFERIEKNTKVIDIVNYIVPGGSLIHNLFVKKDLINIFNYRKEALDKIFN
tara:strand:+ start:1124 stop:1891 length:768 start_codon:yes stop_codon:yes gene_type:complete